MFNYCCRISAPNDEAFEEARRLGVYAAEAACPLERYTPEELEELRSWLIDRGVKIALLDTALPGWRENTPSAAVGAITLRDGLQYRGMDPEAIAKLEAALRAIPNPDGKDE